MSQRTKPFATIAPYLTLVMVLALVCLPAFAQPKISYLTPDLGTTRYGTYVEVIGPHNGNGAFGTDGVYLNNPGDMVRVRCLRPADTAMIKIGPCIVSWNGRLISTMIFVPPTVASNSEDWTKLSPQYRIPIVVEVNGVASQPDTFYIVKPWPVGDKRGNADRILGEGSLGRRSKRGAMLIDSMILAGSDYSVSTADCDAIAPGNQGYLPLTVLSPGRIIGQPGTNIRASANGADGGPGGGGGGGAYYNAIIAGSSGTPGGAGYTGGGPGGENSAIGSSSRKKPGLGSGEVLTSGTVGSASLNGQKGGDATSAYENAGGGTGHPFGQSGYGCDQKDNCSPASAYGAGSGGREGTVGASAGFGEEGMPSPNVSNQGKVYGNVMQVPLAGGSGGASGNPTGASGLASTGGGGGGAVAMHAKLLAQFDVWVQGGTTSINGVAAGGGSGGGVVLGSRLDNSAVGSAGGQVGTPDRPPHLKGGTGRLRFDAWIGTNPGWYVGPISDTTTQSLRNVDILGHGNGNNILVYLKSEHGPWVVIDTISGYGGTWHYVDRLPGTDTLYYLVFGQEQPSPATGTYTNEPSVVLSQTAWNIVRLKGPPVISTDSVRNLGIYRCPGTVVTDTITVTNLGESPLEITSATWTGAAGFTLVSPTVFPDSIASNTSKQYVVTFSPPAGMTGPQVGTLVFDNTDTVKARDPWRTRFSIDVRPVTLNYKFRGTIRDTIDIGELCINTPLADIVAVENAGADPVLLTSYESGDRSLVEVSANLPFTVPVGGFRNLNFSIIAKRVGIAVVPTLLHVDGCAEPDTVWVKFEGLAPTMTLIGTGQFGLVPVGGSKQVLLQIRNDGSSDLEIPSLPAILPPFRLVVSVPGAPAVLRPGATMDLTYEYSPTAAGSHQTTFWIKSVPVGGGGRSCADSAQVVLAGTSLAASVVAVPGTLTFPAIRTCADSMLTVMVRNTGATPVKLTRPAFINGVNAADYTVVREPLADTTLPPNGEARYDVRYAPQAGAASIRTATLSVRTDAPGIPQVDIPLNGSVATINLTGPVSVDMGLIPLGNTGTQVVQYTNNTGADITITQIVSSRPTVTSATPTTFTIANTTSQSITINVTPDAETSSTDTLWLVSETPCADSFPIIVRWTSESASVGITNTLDFGLLSNCADDVDTCYVSNSGKVDVDLIDVLVTGPDAALFTVLNPAIVTNTTLKPGERVGLAVRFDPRGSADGAKSAFLTVRARVANIPTPFRCTLLGNRATSLPSTPGPVVFGLVDVQQSSTQVLTIVNTGLLPVHITAIRVLGSSGGVFTVNAGVVPLTLQPSERLDVLVTFSPTDRIKYSDSLFVDFDLPCADTKAVALLGTGRLNVEVAVRMPFITVSPTEDNLVVPIKAEIVSGAVSTITGDAHFIIRNTTSAYVIQNINPGTIVRNESIAGVTELEVTIPNVTITDQESIIAELHGQATLGLVDSTTIDLAFAELTASGATYTTRPEDGWLVLEICREGGDRLVKKSGALNLSPLPTPATESVTIKAEVFERGLHRLEVVDVNGQVVATDVWTYAPGDGIHMATFDVRSLSSGPYTIHLATPTRHRFTQILVIH